METKPQWHAGLCCASPDPLRAYSFSQGGMWFESTATFKALITPSCAAREACPVSKANDVPTN